MTRADARTVLDRATSEADFRRVVLKHAGLHGWQVVYWHDSRRATGAKGWPDVTLMRPPRFLLRELKREGEELRPEQQWWLEQLQACGIDAGVWRPSDWPEIEAVLR